MIGWITDPHLSFIPDQKALGSSLREDFPNVTEWLITGDIGESYSVIACLSKLQQGLERPVYFVVGNHDYYNSSFDDVDEELSAPRAGLYWIRKAGPIDFGNCCLVGNSGWYDAKYGNSRSRIVLNDFLLINDLSLPYQYNKDLFLQTIVERAKLLAYELGEQLKQAVEAYDKIIIATHVPPYMETCWHEGKISDRDWLPWFTSKATGDIIDRFVENYPNKKFMTLCGHVHSKGIYYHRDNSIVYTGAAEYYNPKVNGLINTKTFEVEILDE